MKQERYFVTGTDTDCGKTWVSCHLLQNWVNQGDRPVGLKPVSSGCQWESGKLVNQDAIKLASICGLEPERINPWRFEPAIAPHIAASMVGESLSADQIAAFCDQDFFQAYKRVLIEGAGGLLVPLNDRETWLDVIHRLSIPVILVVGIKLGCINHALMTMSCLRAQQVKVHGWVANHLDPQTQVQDEIVATLSNFLQAPPFLNLAYETRS